MPTQGSPIASHRTLAVASPTQAGWTVFRRRENVLPKYGRNSKRFGVASVNGSSNCSSLRPGQALRLVDAGPDSGEYFITRIRQSVRVSIEASDVWDAKAYECHVEGIPREQPYRTPLRTPRPKARGTLSAIVVSDFDDEIQTTDTACVEVAFRWDQGAKPQACWARVMQSLAGTGYGEVEIPRKGHEVLIGFRGGDPDQPIVLGSVYNKSHAPVATTANLRHLQGDWHQSVDGTPATRSHWSIDSTLGAERTTLYGERDSRTVAERDHHMLAHGNFVLRVGSPVTSTRASEEGSTTEKRVVRANAPSSTPPEVASDSEAQLMLKTSRNSKQSVGGDYSVTIEKDYSLSLKSDKQVFRLPQRFISGGPITHESISWATAHLASSECCLGLSPIPLPLMGRMDVTLLGMYIRLSATLLSRRCFRGVKIDSNDAQSLEQSLAYTYLASTTAIDRACNRIFNVARNNHVSSQDVRQGVSASEQNTVSMNNGMRAIM